MSTDVLDLLVLDRDELDRCWEDEPFVSRGLPPFDDVFSLDRLNRVVFEEQHARSFFRLFHHGTEQSGSLASRRRERAPGEHEALLDPATARELVAGGHTLVVEEVRTLLPEVAAFADRLETEIGHGCYCAAFLSPPDGVGAGAHWDVGSVFLRQVHGEKTWTLGRPVERWITRPWNRTPVTFEDEVTLTLGEGDCLYIPRGWIHEGHTASKFALHLSVAVQATTWHDLAVRAVRASAADDPMLREALPPRWRRGGPEDLAAELAARMCRVPTEQVTARAHAHLGRTTGPTARPEGLAPGILAWEA